MAFGSSRLTLLLLVILVSAPLAVIAAEEVTYLFGISLGLNSTIAGTLAKVQYDNKYGLEIWRDWWNQRSVEDRTTKYGVTFKVELHIEDYSNLKDGNMYELFEVYRQMQEDHPIDFYFVPTTTPWDIQTRNYTYYELGIPFMVATGDSSEAYYATPGSYGAPTANIFSVTSWLPYLRVGKAKSIAIIQADENFQRELCLGVVTDAPLNDIDVIGHYKMPFDYPTYGDPAIGNRSEVWKKVLDEVIEANPDAVAICDFGIGSEFALNYMREKNWLPKSVLVSVIILPFKDPSLLDYVTLTTSYSPKAKFPVQYNFTDSAGYDQLVRDRYNIPANYLIARATLGGMIFTNAIMRAADNSSEAIKTALATSQFPSFMGTSAMDPESRQTRLSLVLQLLKNNTDHLVIGPALAAADAYIYPMPTWDERIFDVKWGWSVEIAGAVLMALGVAITIGWAIFLIIHRNHKVMVAASPVFCYAILAGALIVYVSIFNWMPNLVDDSICNLRPWLLPLGFMTMFGSLLAKTHRIYKLYYDNTITIMRISNIRVALTILIIVVAQSILSVLMVTVTGLKAKVKVVDPDRVSKNFYVCEWPTSLQILFGINVAYAAALLAWGTYLAYRIRKVPISIYDESKVIGFSIYNTAFFGVIVIVIQLAVTNGNRQVSFMITAVCCFLGATITISCLFAAKWYAIYGSSRSRGSRMTTTTTTSSSGNSNGPSTRSGSRDGSVINPIANATDKNKRYKKKISTLKEQKRALQLRIKELEELARSNGLVTGDVELKSNPKHAADDESAV